MPAIPIHQLQDRTEQGLIIDYFEFGNNPKDKESMGTHRDDHYIFFLLTEGRASLMIDFQEVIFGPGTLFYILPGQVHHRIRNEDAAGWFMAVDAGLIGDDRRKVFEQMLTLQQPIVLDTEKLQQYHTLLKLINQCYQNDRDQPFYRPVVLSLLQGFTGMVAACYSCVQTQGKGPSRKVQLAHDFKKLLADNLKAIKSPAEYADMLNVSLSYLTESIKVVTGFPVSYWIINEVMLEARRLLYYSNLTVKEVAYDLGYDDHAYFSRLFKKTVGASPAAFRLGHRE